LKIFRQLVKWTGITIGTIIILPIILMMLLYIPPIQNWAVKTAIAFASEASGMNINLEKVGISFPLDIELQNLIAMQEQDTILHTESIIIDLDFNKVYKKQIGIETIEIREGAFNSLSLIPQMKIKGSLGLLILSNECTDFEKGVASISGAQINRGDLDIVMQDTTIIDTTSSSPLPWIIQVDNIGISNTRIGFRSAGDTLALMTKVNDVHIYNGDIDLLNSIYMVDKLRFGIDTLSLTMTDSTGVQKHIPLSATSLKVDGFKMDTTHVDLHNLHLHTGTENYPISFIDGKAYFEFNAFTPDSGGIISAELKTSFAHSDILTIAKDYIPQELSKVYPSVALNADIKVYGNIDSIAIKTMRAHMPKVINIDAKGDIHNLLLGNKKEGDFNLDVSTGNLNLITKFLKLSDINIPKMDLSAKLQMHGNTYKADAILKQADGSMNVKGMIDIDNMAYRAKITTQNLNIANFLPNDSIGLLTFSTKLQGHGTDPLSKSTGFEGEFDLKQLEYKNLNINHTRLTALLKQGLATIDFTCDNDLLIANACVGADVTKTYSKADFSLSLNKINFHALGITKDSIMASMVLNADGHTDMKQTHRLMGGIHSMEISTPDTTYYPLDLDIKVEMNEQSILAKTSAGDLNLNFEAAEGIDSLIHKFTCIAKELNYQKDNKKLNHNNIKDKLPKLSLKMSCKDNNPLANITRSMLGARFNDLNIELKTDLRNGINGYGQLNKLRTSAIMLDSISWDIKHLNEGIDITSRVKNGPRNKVVNFESNIHALLKSNGLETSFLFIDDKGEKGVDFGMNFESNDSSIRVSLSQLNPIIAYRQFDVNKDNHISLNKTNHLSANMNLLADDGTNLKLYSSPNENAQQDITLSIANFNLGELSNVLPFMPVVTGMLNGDIHALKEDEQATLSVDMDIINMGYEGSKLGDIGMEVIYFPNTDGSHLMDAILSQNQREIILLNGKYWSTEHENLLEAEAHLIQVPMNMANGLIANKVARLEGYLSGILDVHGPISSPILSGTLSTDSMHICSDPYSIYLQMPDDTVEIKNNFIDLNKLQVFANGNNPLTLDGKIDFSDLNQAKINLNVVARDFNLINAPKRKGAEAYGKVYVDLLGRVKGTLSDLDISGRLNINGKTNLTYVMKDSPLVVEDQLNSLVSFVDFSDTLEVPKTVLPEQNVKMNLQVNIDEATTIHCLMSEDGQDKIDLEGGGELRMTYDMLSGLKLFGRYTVLSGRIDYSLVLVSLKNFQVDSGSYIEFLGDIMNPNLNISASERKKASVTTNKTTRTVNFNVGLKITQSLEDLGLEFTLKAPEDLSVQNELSSMSVEERGRAAVTMLTTGMYLSPNSENGGGSFDATSALNSFLNSQISNIAGKALSTIDIGFGIDNSTSLTGAAQTDYNFSFAKRFWGNRISVIIGGKVSSGNDAQNTGMSIINNVSIEYRLDNSGTRYVKAFYNKDTESILDSEVMEMGGSLVLRRKTEKLGELFIFRDKKQKQRNPKVQKNTRQKDSSVSKTIQ
jgi:hypothetical protein